MRLSARLLVPCLAAVLLAGCGMRFVYTQLDWLLPWYARDYVTLEPVQRSELDRRLGALLDWHCRDQLPAYVVLLRDAQAALRDGPVTAARLEEFLLRGEALWDRLMQAVAPDAAGLLAELSDAQVAELGAAFERRNAEAREEFLEGRPADLRERRIARMEKRLQRWFGRLNAAQRARIGEWNNALMLDGEAWLARRVAWQQALLAALEQRADRAALAREVEALLRTPQEGWTAEYRAQAAYNREQTLALLADIANSATPRQRKHLLAEVGGLAGQFDGLACRAPAGQAA
ncbi:DUF6279 family lipoprotein [Pseudothauera rhizosphaerae]|uniref:Lipoprotein n=1 Tax=Pseudothauera rhizosphaerae TaxID=2565932 RepID=A0A4S4AS37_9RHOO|nr:DUF6279 family lipoprotein [Pseudothauera rhizosphaerae]THF61998.1 hypothetical protein E6O51_07485 [Pseudothauera rhizosphaerae]